MGKSGDVFVLKGGSTWAFSSTTADLLTVRASGITIMGGQRLASPWGTGYPVLDGSTSTVARYGIYMNGKSNVTIDGIKIANLVNYSDGSGQGIVIFGAASSIEVKNCYIDNVGVVALGYSPSGSVAHLLFHDNTVTNCGRVHVLIDTGVSVDDVQLYNNIMLGPGTWPAHNYHGDGFYVGANSTTNPSTLTNVVIHHNRFYGNWSQGATALIYLDAGGGPSGQSNRWGGYHAKIYDNLLAIDTDGVISPGFITIYDGWKDVKIYNNTISAKTTSNPVSHCIFLAYLPTDAAIDVRNNILSGCANGITAGGMNASTGLTVQNNLYRTNGGNHFIWDKDSGGNRWDTLADLQAHGYEKNANAASLVNVDPKFIQLPNGTTGSGNWNLQSSSPARSGGIAYGSPYNIDLNGITALGYIGAYAGVLRGTPLAGPSSSSNVCVPLATLTRTIQCPAGQTGTITQQQVSTCPGPIYGDWVTVSNTCKELKIVKRIWNR
jgi:hypothetical protein